MRPCGSFRVEPADLYPYLSKARPIMAKAKQTSASSEFQVSGKNQKALFTLKIHRGDGMCLLGMNWKKGKPPKEFVGADIANGENLLLIRDRRIAVSYVVEAVRIFDHYHFRVVQADARTARKKLQLAKRPRKPGERPWWAEDYINPRKILDRELFA